MSKSKQTSEKKKNRFFTRKYLIILAVCAAVCMTAAGVATYAYLDRADYYSKHFYEGTIINTVDCSDLTAQEASERIREMVESYSFTLIGPDNKTYQVTAADLGIKYDSEKEITALLAKQDAIRWPFEKDDAGIHTVSMDLSYSKLELDKWIAGLDFLKNGESPENAYEYFSESGYWDIMPEKEGSLVDSKRVCEKIYQAVDAGETFVDLNDEDYYIRPAVRSDDPQLNADVEKKNKALETSYRIEELTNAVIYLYSYMEGEYYTLDSSIYRPFITVSDDGSVGLDRASLLEWYTDWADERELIGNNCLFLTSDHQVIIVDQGVDTGWSLDVESTVDKIYNAILDQDNDIILPVLRDSSDTQIKDSTYIEISIQQQHMWCYINGVLKVETPVVTGDVTKYNLSTPTDGIWHINYKQMNHHMYGPQLADGTYEYEVDVTYWMPFSGYVGIHDAAREVFGGTEYIGNGSHACVNTPYEAAEQIYQLVSAGTKVVIYG